MSKIGSPKRIIEIEPIEEPAAEPVKVPEPCLGDGPALAGGSPPGSGRRPERAIGSVLARPGLAWGFPLADEATRGERDVDHRSDQEDGQQWHVQLEAPP